MAHLPTGTVTFLLTDIEGSTRLWEQHPEAMRLTLARHHALLTAQIEQQGGSVVKSQGEGDSLFAAFAHPADAVAAACALQQALLAEPWPAETPVRVRIALHTGEADLREGDYYGPSVNRCARLRSAGHGGQILLSLATEEQVQDHLPEGVSLRDLGERRLKDLIRPERIFQLLAPNLPQEFPPLNTLDLRPNNLPAQTTPLVGRETDVAAVRDLLRRDEVRLATLTGPGGTGKTRLGLQVAADLIDDFESGVFFIELAPITDPDLVVSTIAQTLGVREVGGTPLLESLQEYLREKQLLLCLDNFEQVLEAAPLVAELLAAAPRLKVLVTSRAVLRVRGEHEFPVSPLALPDLTRLPPAEALSRYAAVELFLQRASAVRADFAVTDENARAVAEICSRLDGLPLAIELAAARAKLLSPQAMLTRLEDRLKLLTGGARDLPTRQQTLRNTIAWSYDLLEESEQRLFRWLSVFVGGFMLEAAETVCNAAVDLGIDVLDGVASLVDKSLLRQEEQPDADARFGMLETIREYGCEALATSGEAEALGDTHARFFLTLAEEAIPKLRRITGPERQVWSARLQRDHANLRGALEWLHFSPSGEEMELQLAALLGACDGVPSFAERERRQQLARALSRSTEETQTRAQALVRASYLASRVREYEVARPLAEEALAIWRERGDQRGIAGSLGELGVILNGLGKCESARVCEEECISIFRALGEAENVAIAVMNVGLSRMFQGEFAEAHEYLEESFAMFQELGDPPSPILQNLGMLAIRERDRTTAHAFATRRIKLQRELGREWAPVWAVMELASVAAAWGQPQRAARLFGAVETFWETQGISAKYPVPELYECLETARAQLGEEAFTAAFSAGRAMTPEEVVAYALEEARGNVPPDQRSAAM